MLELRLTNTDVLTEAITAHADSITKMASALLSLASTFEAQLNRGANAAAPLVLPQEQSALPDPATRTRLAKSAQSVTVVEPAVVAAPEPAPEPEPIPVAAAPAPAAPAVAAPPAPEKKLTAQDVSFAVTQFMAVKPEDAPKIQRLITAFSDGTTALSKLPERNYAAFIAKVNELAGV